MEGKRDERMNEIRERWAKATDGPWQATLNPTYGPAVWTNHGAEGGCTRFRVVAGLDQSFKDDDGVTQWEYDMLAVRSAPQDIEFLLSEVERLRNRDMVEAVCGILYSLEEFFERASGQTTDYDDFIIRSRTLRHMLKEGSDG